MGDPLSGCRELRLQRARLVVRYLSGESEQMSFIGASERARIAPFLEQLNFELSTGRVARNGAIGRHRIGASPGTPPGKPATGLTARL